MDEELYLVVTIKSKKYVKAKLNFSLKEIQCFISVTTYCERMNTHFN